MSADAESLKRECALRAVEYVQDGMVVGLGTGTTTRYAIEAIGRKVASGLRIKGIPTSDRTADMARDLGIPLTTLEDSPRIDITIDGADEIELGTLHAIKGHGGALLHEKLVAESTVEQILIVDESKVVQHLGDHNTTIPVEVVAFAWSRTTDRLAAIGAQPELRKSPDGSVFVTDSGNYVVDCTFPHSYDPAQLATRIKSITGVVDHGLFINLVARVVIASTNGVRVIDKQ